MATDSPALMTCMECRSASEYTATLAMPIRSSVRTMRQAIAPRLAIRTLRNISGSGTPNQKFDGRRVVGIAGIVQLRAVRNEGDHIHMLDKLDVLAGRRKTVGEVQCAV